jgi:hypothetical protein
MITPGHLKASVVNIEARRNWPERIAIDAQIFYFVFYPNFSYFSYSGINIPRQHASGKYSRYLEGLRIFKHPPREPGGADRPIQIYTAGHTIGEFARTYEFAEIEILWRNDPNNRGSRFDPKICKEVRYQYSERLATIRANVETAVTSLRTLVSIIPKPPSEEKELTECLGLWKESLADYADSVLLGRAKSLGITDILSDDADLATFDGIRLFTANDSVIRAATAAGRCENSLPAR